MPPLGTPSPAGVTLVLGWVIALVGRSFAPCDRIQTGLALIRINVRTLVCRIRDVGSAYYARIEQGTHTLQRSLARGRHVERRLAAILAADVVGYSRLMEQDESGTFERLRAHRKELFEPEIARHHGRVFKLMGDGLLAEFASAVNAVECAIVLQQGLAQRNDGLPGGQRIDCRIGVNLGDLIVESDAGAAMDMHGDGVNIANRLQALAKPGDVLISGAVYDQLKKKIGAGFEFLGEQTVKNIAEPVRLYRVLQDSAQAGRTVVAKARGPFWRWPSAAAVVVLALIAGALAWTQPWQLDTGPPQPKTTVPPIPSDRPSIAVLPFANMSDDPKQEYFADGMTDDLITELSKLSGLFVISRNSSFAYKGRSVPMQQVSQELGVRYVLEGSVQRSGNQLRINAQLIDAVTGGHAWADRFDGSADNVFALQDKVTRSIADALELKLNPAEQQALSTPDTAVPAAYDALLKGMEYFRLTTGRDYAKAIPYFEEAIKLDPQYGRAYAALALLYARTDARGYFYDIGLTPAEVRARGSLYAERVKAISIPLSHQIVGYRLMTVGDPTGAIAEFKEAIAQNPGDAWNYGLMGWALTGNGQPAEAVGHFETALRLNPKDSIFLTFWLGAAQFGQGKFDIAAQTLEAVTRANPEDDYALVLLVATYGYLGRLDDAKSAITRYNEHRAQLGDIALTIETAPYLGLTHYPARQNYLEGLRRAGVPGSYADGQFAGDRLTADETRTLVFGHKLFGRSFWDGSDDTLSVTMDGDMTTRGVFWFRPGKVQLSGNRLCLEIGASLGECAFILRNPGGSKERYNEYIWASTRWTFAFSQIE